jgi:hypothetical protein
MASIRQGIEELGRFTQQAGQPRRRTGYPQPKHDIERVQVGPAPAHRFAKKPSQVVAIDRAGELLFADDKSNPADRAFRG